MVTPDLIDPDTRDPGSVSTRPPWVVPVVITAIVVLPLLVAAVVLAARGWSPSGEFAQAEFRMRGFWSSVPDLGAVGRLRTSTDVSSHPGPTTWWLLYPLYAVGGRTPAALSGAVAGLAAAWISLSLWLSWRRGGVALMVALGATLALFVRALGPAVFTEPWNPWFAIFPFLCFLLATWDVLCGHRWTLPLVVFAGTVCVQAHVGYAPLVAVITVAPVLSVLWSLREPDGRRGVAGVLAAAAGVLVVLWLPPVVQQLTGDPGNMTVLVDAYGEQVDPALGIRGAVDLVGGQVDLVGPWMLNGDQKPQDRGIGVGTVALGGLWLLAAAVAWWRRGDTRWRPIVTLHGVCAGAVLVAVPVASRILGEVFDYLIPFLSVITVLIVTAVAWTAWTWVDQRAGRSRRSSTGPVSLRMAAAVGALLVLAGAGAVGAAQFAAVETPAAEWSDSVSDLGPQVTDALDPGGTYLVRWEDPLAFGGAGFGLMADMERRGYTVGADVAYRVEVRPDRVLDPREADAAIWVVTGAGIERWRADPGAVEIAAHDPRSAAERRRAEQLGDEIRNDLAEVGDRTLADQLDTNYWATRSDPRVDDDLRARIDRWAALGAPTAVFLHDPDATPAP